MDFLKNLKLDDQKPHSNDSSPQTHERGLFDKVNNALNEHASPSTPPAANTTNHGNSLLGKITNAMADHHAPTQTPQTPKHEGLLGKISSAVTGEHAAPPPPSPPKQEPGLSGIIAGVLSSHDTGGNKQNAGGLLGKLGDVVSGQHHQQEPPKPQGFTDKINNMLGGGAKGEQKEDALDKAIDFVQEHVLKAGPQHNESALEQAKDKQIADAIRGQYQKFTGKEFPGSHKK
ncbi:hypothetical protein BD779DRAFT_1524353 [Infundibulicybe gibba]|nr:hypothetical protein BD779DRAFT_1524353 [Infundibulicybe gibba]